MQRTLIVLLALALTTVGSAEQSSVTVFKGRPSVKVSEGGLERTQEQVAADRAINLECVISQIGSKYYWASRENVEMERVDEGGAFITFVALNGSGHVRVVKPEAKAGASLMSATEKQFDYVAGPRYVDRIDRSGTEHIGSEDTFEGDYGRLLDRFYAKNAEWLASPTGFEPVALV